jgi:hypothetical protein
MAYAGRESSHLSLSTAAGVSVRFQKDSYVRFAPTCIPLGAARVA